MMAHSSQFDAELTDIKQELENIIEEILAQEYAHDKIDTARLNDFLNAFDLSNKNTSSLENFKDQLQDFQQSLENATNKVKDRCQEIQHQLTTIDRRHHGVNTYTQNQFLTSRKGI